MSSDRWTAITIVIVTLVVFAPKIISAWRKR